VFRNGRSLRAADSSRSAARRGIAGFDPNSFALMAIPAVTTTMAIIFRRTATNGVQSSLYVVYLKGVGLSGTSIGILFAAIAI
jgi:hypothetical protein